ncbi:ABC transporter substrate-binding protein, partial [Patescibacteria group bacterium]
NTWVPMLGNELDNVPNSVMGTADFAQNYYPVITSDVASGTGLVGVPMGYDALTLFVNEKMFKEEGISYPTNWVELREAAKSLTKREEGQITRAGVAMGRTENVDHWQEIVGLMLIQNGVNLSNPEGQNTEDVIAYYTLFSRADKVWDETLPQSTAAFAAGKVAMYFGRSWRAFNIEEQNPDLEFRTIPLPQLPKESPDEPSISYATYWVEGVWTKSKNKDVAWDFIKFLSQKQTLEKFYKSASDARGFGEAYPRVDMQQLLADHPIQGSIISLAPVAQSWYLADRTFDGDTGINSQISKYFEDAINGINTDLQMEDVMKTLTPGVVQVLTQYGLVQ